MSVLTGIDEQSEDIAVGVGAGDGVVSCVNQLLVLLERFLIAPVAMLVNTQSVEAAKVI